MDRPILFSDRLVRRLPGVEGEPAKWKTQTRRLPGPTNTDGWRHGWRYDLANAWADGTSGGALYYLHARRARHDTVHRLFPRYEVGDRLWVREAWRPEERAADGVDGIRFRADDAFVPIENSREAADRWVDQYDRPGMKDRWRPSIHIPRWASRVTLDVSGVRVERLQEITEADAKAEGADPWALPIDVMQNTPGDRAYRTAFRYLWDSVNGHRSAARWSANPWVWVITFATAAEVARAA